MAKKTDPHPERGQVRMLGAFAEEDFLEAEEHDEHADPRLERDAEIESNELHVATGEKCKHCGQVIAPNSDVRKMPKGGYVHELCPPH